MSRTTTTLKPTAGFCIKTTTLQPSSYTPSSLKQSFDSSIPIPQGYKIFVNVAWDANVPPPPKGSEDAIQRAMCIDGEGQDERNRDSWFVPVVVSDGRLDTDKAGKPSLVFDCVFHNSVKSRTLRDPEFKVFIIELSFQRIEAQSQLVLSREIGMPNIAAKGKLQPRTVSIPSFLAPPASEAKAAETIQVNADSMKKPLIEEIITTNTSGYGSEAIPAVKKQKGILKSSSATAPSVQTPTWSWFRSDSDRLQIQIEVPPVEKHIITLSYVDIEPRRLIFSIPNYPMLDINLSLSDAELVARSERGSSLITELASSTGGNGGSAINKLLGLKRQRPFDVGSATADWIIAENKLLISV